MSLRPKSLFKERGFPAMRRHAQPEHETTNHLLQWRWLPAPTQAGQVGGHEGVGKVAALGPGTENAGLKIGDRVGIKWMAGVCGNCIPCLGKLPTAIYGCHLIMVCNLQRVSMLVALQARFRVIIPPAPSNSTLWLQRLMSLLFRTVWPATWQHLYCAEA